MSGSTADTHRRLVAIGGGLSRDNADVYHAILRGRDGPGPICVIPTASADPDAAVESAISSFDRYGGPGTAIGLPLSVESPVSAYDAGIVDMVNRCSGFYFSGGVQSRILTVFRPGGLVSPVHAAVMARFQEGAVVAGSSAGAAILSHPMIAGGTSASAVIRGVTSSDDDDAGVIITAGLGYVTGMLMDQHFLARGRIGRLLVAVDLLPDVELAFGIDENTALVIHGDSAWPVGASGVVVIDERGVDGDTGGVHDDAGDLVLHLLSAGDRFSISTGRVTTDPVKTAVIRAAAMPAVPEDIFGRWQFLHLLAAFGAASTDEISVPIEGGTVLLRRTPETAALRLPGTGVQGTAAGLTVTNLRIGIPRRD
ncbi:hypothetical protein BH23GEM10_BH23GEM10_01500 [soil metagenome]